MNEAMTNRTGRRRTGELSGADHFVLALNVMMRRADQGQLNGQTHLELAQLPDPVALAKACEELFDRHPILRSRVQRHPLSLRAAWYLCPRITRGPILNFWKEPGALVANETAWNNTSSAQGCAEQLLNEMLPKGQNVRFDLIARWNEKPLLVITWSHLLFDGKGAEMLAAELAGEFRSRVHDEDTSPHFNVHALLKNSRAAVMRFYELTRMGFRSLGGPKPRKGCIRYTVHSFSKEETSRIFTNSSMMISPLLRLPFYLATATRAHRAAFLLRGEDPEHFVVSVPVQVRRKGAVPSMFQNHVSILFFAVRREDLFSLEAAALAIQKQFAEMMKGRLGESFDSVLRLMRRLPSLLYYRFVALQFGGEVTSFFHSHTGAFSPSVAQMYGAEVTNAYHVPSVSAPPGTGLFFSEFNDRLTYTFSWREGCVSPTEQAALLDQLHSDLLTPTSFPIAETV